MSFKDLIQLLTDCEQAIDPTSELVMRVRGAIYWLNQAQEQFQRNMSGLQ